MSPEDKATQQFSLINGYCCESMEVLNHLPPEAIRNAANEIVKCFRAQGKLLICGNGGSAADAQHFAAELVGHYKVDREPLPAIALTVDSSALTAIGNDYGFEHVFARQIAAIGSNKDWLLAISTSGNSINVIQALVTAQDMGINTIGLTGQHGGDAQLMSGGGQIRFEQLCDICIKVPSVHVGMIQQAHITICHIICELIDAEYGPE